MDERSGLTQGVPKDEMHPDDIEDSPFYRPELAQIFRQVPHLKPGILYSLVNITVMFSGCPPEKYNCLASGHVQESVLPCDHIVPMTLVQENAGFIGSTILFSELQALNLQRAREQVPHHEGVSIDKQ